jgi:hypothetical protein
MMKRIKFLRLCFNNSIAPSQIRAFRAAISRLAGRDNVLFHHHLNNGLLYRYPLIQYKIIRQQPCLIALEEGTDVLQYLFSQKDWSVQIGQTVYQLEVQRIDMRQVPLQVWDQSFAYRITNWLALNPTNYKKYLTNPSLASRIRDLERILTAHILSFAEGVQWNIEKKVEVIISHIHTQRWVKFKNIGLLAFDMTFTANVSLPEYAGLGKATSIGFGTLRRIRTQQVTSKQFSKETVTYE